MFVEQGRRISHMRNLHSMLGIRQSPDGVVLVLGPDYVGQPEGNGSIQRFFRTLKEQLLWLRRFRNLDELREALTEFRQRYNELWILERLQYRTPAQARRDFSLELG